MKDRLASHNERVKITASTANALGLAFVVLGFIRPLSEKKVVILTESEPLGGSLDKLNALKTLDQTHPWLNSELEFLVNQNAPTLIAWVPGYVWFVLAGLALHITARYILGYLRKAE